jgi:hypothetical protein
MTSHKDTKDGVFDDCNKKIVHNTSNSKYFIFKPQVKVMKGFEPTFWQSEVFNTRILDATNYMNQDYMRVITH